MPFNIDPAAAHFHKGAIRMSVSEWEDLLKLLIKKQPELVGSFKANSFRLHEDVMVVLKRDGCVFYEPKGCRCMLRETLTCSSDCPCVFGGDKG